MDEDLITDENPATRLWQLLTDWRATPANEIIYDQRGGAGEFWARSVEAIHWCDLTYAQVVEQARAEPQVAVQMDPVIDACRSAIFSVDNQLTANVNGFREHISTSNLLALYLFARSWLPVTLNATAAADVLDLVQRLRKMVIKEPGLDNEVKDYIVQLTINIESTLLAKRIWGTVDLRGQSLQLAAALQALVVDGENVDPKTKEEGKGLLKRFYNRVNTSFWVDLVPKMVGAGWSAAQKAIEQGSGDGS